MKTQHELAYTLKTLMSEMPLEDISVSLLTKKCKVNRQTFYYYFHDIYDLLTQVFLDENIEFIANVNNYSELVTEIYNYFIKNEKFIVAVINSGAKDLFLEFIYNIFYQFSLKYFAKFSEAQEVTPNNKKHLARFYASGYSNVIVYYLSTHNKKSLHSLLGCFSFMKESQIKQALKNYNDSRK